MKINFNSFNPNFKAYFILQGTRHDVRKTEEAIMYENYDTEYNPCTLTQYTPYVDFQMKLIASEDDAKTLYDYYNSDAYWKTQEKIEKLPRRSNKKDLIKDAEKVLTTIKDFVKIDNIPIYDAKTMLNLINYDFYEKGKFNYTNVQMHAYNSSDASTVTEPITIINKL